MIEGSFGQAPLSNHFSIQEFDDIIESFLSKLCRHKHPSQIPDDIFFQYSFDFINSFINSAIKDITNRKEISFFLEKTPHSLLSLHFLQQIYPDSTYVHVIRDPRSIAFSLQKMNWGPSDLNTCCAWVQSYFDAWFKVASKIRASDTHLIELQIEDVARRPQHWSIQCCGSLGIANCETVFDGAHADQLDSWLHRASSDDLKTLREELSVLAMRLGYLEAEIGILLDSFDDSASSQSSHGQC